MCTRGKNKLTRLAKHRFASKFFYTFVGGIVQKVERMLCTHKVIGSIPVISKVDQLDLGFAVII